MQLQLLACVPAAAD